jgi:transcriptional regulator GlxA family with amidase domain
MAILSICTATLLLGCENPPTPVAEPAPAEGEQTQPAAGVQWRRAGWESGAPVDRSLSVGFLIVNGVYNTELTAPLDLFHHTVFHTDPAPGMTVFTISPDGQPVTTFEGLVVHPDHGFDTAPPIDVLVVPSAEHSMDTDLEDRRMMDWVKRAGTEARFVVSLCDGAFVLAAAGLLDGRQVTTFPGDQDRFAEMFPQLQLRRGVSFVHDGPVLTSEGGARSFDVAMHLIDHIYGEQVAVGVGRGLIIPWPPVPGSLPALVVEP